MNLCNRINEELGLNEGPDTPSYRLITKINDEIANKGLAGKKFSKVTGAFEVLSAFIADREKINAIEAREYIREMTDKQVPELKDVMEFAMKKAKKLKLVESLNEAMESKLVRVSDSVVIKYEGNYEKAMRGQIIAKAKVHIEIHGERPFENSDYRTLASAIFTDQEDSKPLEFTDEVNITENPVDDAKKWIKDKIKNYKKL